MVNRFLSFLFIIMISAGSIACADTVKSGIIADKPVPGLVDSSKVDLRQDSAYFLILSDSRSFVYVEKEPMPSLVDIILERINRWLDDFIRGAAHGGVQLYILILLFLLIVWFILRKLLGKNSASLFFSNRQIISPSVYMGDIDKTADYETLAETAAREGNYKDAVRFLYLNILRNMDIKNLIYWAPGKTNYDYYYEIKETSIKSGFRNVSTIFNYIEFGNFRIDESIYSRARSSFAGFNDNLKAVK